MKSRFLLCITTILFLSAFAASAQKKTDSNTPLHLSRPDYVTPYKIPARDEIVEVLDRVYHYLEANTPPQLVDGETGGEINDFSKIKNAKHIGFKQGDFRLISYEWGVTRECYGQVKRQETLNTPVIPPKECNF